MRTRPVESPFVAVYGPTLSRCCAPDEAGCDTIKGMKRLSVLGYPVDAGTLSELLNTVETGLNGGTHQRVVTLNPEMLMRGEAEPPFARLLREAEVILPDGAGVVWALRRKHPQVERIPGIEFSEALMAHAAKHGHPVALIGAQPEVIEATRQNLVRRFPGLNIVYSHHGFFTSPQNRSEVAKACAEARPRYVFVALGVPGQERWIDEYRTLFSEPAAFVGVGGSFDVWSGMKRRAPDLFLRLNLEWLYRITSEPFRLKRVYKTLPMFVVKVLLYDSQPAEGRNR